MKSKLFRTHILGGYRKEDVDEYVQALEAEIIRLEGETQDRPGARTESAGAESSRLEDFIVLDSSGETPQAVQDQPEPSPAGAGGELERVKAELDEERVKCGQTERLLQKMISEKQQLTDELEALRRTQLSAAEDRDAIKEVLMNARVNAEIIMTKARREARLLLEDTHRQISQQKREAMVQLMGQLSENYSGLQVSKNVLKEQIRSIEGIERQLVEIQEKVRDSFEPPVNGGRE